MGITLANTFTDLGVLDLGVYGDRIFTLRGAGAVRVFPLDASGPNPTTLWDFNTDISAQGIEVDCRVWTTHMQTMYVGVVHTQDGVMLRVFDSGELDIPQMTGIYHGERVTELFVANDYSYGCAIVGYDTSTGDHTRYLWGEIEDHNQQVYDVCFSPGDPTTHTDDRGFVTRNHGVYGPDVMVLNAVTGSVIGTCTGPDASTSFEDPLGIACVTTTDHLDWVFVVDSDRHCVDVFNRSMVWSTTFGTDDLWLPIGIWARNEEDGSISVWVADYGHDRVAQFTID